MYLSSGRRVRVIVKSVLWWPSAELIFMYLSETLPSMCCYCLGSNELCAIVSSQSQVSYQCFSKVFDLHAQMLIEKNGIKMWHTGRCPMCSELQRRSSWSLMSARVEDACWTAKVMIKRVFGRGFFGGASWWDAHLVFGMSQNSNSARSFQLSSGAKAGALL